MTLGKEWGHAIFWTGHRTCTYEFMTTMEICSRLNSSTGHHRQGKDSEVPTSPKELWATDGCGGKVRHYFSVA